MSGDVGGVKPVIQGTKFKLLRWVEGQTSAGRFVVRLDVDAVIPDADTSEPCFEPAALRLLDDAQRLAAAGRLDDLARIGEVFFRTSA